MRNTCEELFGGGKVAFALDMFRALEYAGDAAKTIFPDKADLDAGRAAKVIRELEPFSGRCKQVEACCRYYRNKIERMRYNQYRDQGMQIGSGVVESGCKRYGLRLKRPGTRWSETGAPTQCRRSKAASQTSGCPTSSTGTRGRQSLPDNKLGYTRAAPIP